MQLISKANFLAGKYSMQNKGKINLIFDELVSEFLDEFSKKILEDNSAKKYGDLIAFAFWIRKKRILRIKNFFFSKLPRLGRGLAFHITPSNVPLNFAYSFVISLLSGNNNIVRVTNKNYNQNILFFKIIKKLFEIKKFKPIMQNNLFIKYSYNENITKYLSSICDCRIIWGSDKTVNEIRKLEIKPSCVELVFADKYSLSIINLNSISKLSKKKIDNLVLNFFNDAFLFNQKSCTSPHLIIWTGKKNRNYEVFWENLHNLILNNKIFNPSEKEIFDRYNKFCEFSSSEKNIKSANINSNFYRMTLSRLPEDLTELRHGHGFFFEFFSNNYQKIMEKMNSKVQTVTYFGLKKDFLKKVVENYKPKGINRVVPVGRASEFNENWDGYDLIRSLSKIIELL